MAILIFDYDGTLHDSMHIYGPAVRNCHRAMASAGLVQLREISEEEIRSYLGLSIEEMWLQFAPYLSPELREAGGKQIGAELRRSVEAGEAKLYPGALEILEKLKAAGNRLIFLSNCTESYMELHKKAFHLDKYFDEMYCSEQFSWKEKYLIAEELMKGREVEKVIAIGDRYKDINIGRKSNGKVKTIWCAYGFGKEEEGLYADQKAFSAADIINCIENI